MLGKLQELAGGSMAAATQSLLEKLHPPRWTYDLNASMRPGASSFEWLRELKPIIGGEPAHRRPAPAHGSLGAHARSSPGAQERGGGPGGKSSSFGSNASPPARQKTSMRVSDAVRDELEGQGC